LLDKFNGGVCNWVQSLKEVETNPKNKLINDDPNQSLFTESERWHMAALGFQSCFLLALQENM
jgi:hypothetical protein